MNFVWSKIKRHYPVLILLTLEIALFLTNYTPGTYFLGWDNLFPEMNFPANFIRSLFSVWQEYRGLGLLDGMSYAANLPHYLFIYILSFVLPQNLLRYFFIFFMHFLGGAGVYFLISELLEGQNWKRLVSFLGSLFYLLNFATVQMFFTPYEVFTVHFAFLPILILFLIKYLKSGSKKHLFWLAILSFLSTPQAHVPTLFIVFAIAFSTILFSHFLFAKKAGLKRIITVFAVMVCINSFWGLPYVYSALNNAKTINNSKINQMSTEDIYLKNKAYGNFTNVVLLKSFSLDFVDNLPDGTSGYMMKSWRKQVKNPIFVGISLAFFMLALAGITGSIVRKERRFYPFIFLFLLAFLMLGDDIPLLGGFAWFLRNYVPYFYQIFRFTFTKFSILYVFAFSVLISVGLAFLFEKIEKTKFIGYIIIGIFLIGFAYNTHPSWQGNFLYKNLRVKLPNDYFELVKYLKTQDHNTRVALLPQVSFYGWTYNRWGYKGSGFIWYGITQVTLDGAFYPWSRENENYYWEITQAVNQREQALFESVLDKYQIGWLVVDKTMTSPSSGGVFYMDRLEELIEKSNKLQLVKTLEKINIYQVNLNTAPHNFVFLSNHLPSIQPRYQWGGLDQAYFDNQTYILSTGEKTKEVYYPFRTLFSGKRQEDLEFKVEDKGDYFSFRTKIPKELLGSKLIIPKINKEEVTDYDKNDLPISIEKYPQMYLDGELIQISMSNLIASELSILLSYIRKGNLEVRVPKITGYYSYDLHPTSYNLQPVNCDQFNKGIYTHEKMEDNLLRLASINSSNCLDFDLSTLSQRLVYLVTVENRNIDGKSLLFSVINKNSQRADLETYLPKQSTINNQQLTVNKSYFVIPPMEQYGLGYSLHFDNISIGRVKTVNDLGRITVNPIPYRFLTSLRIVKEEGTVQPTRVSTDGLEVTHNNPSFYQITLPITYNLQPTTTLVLSQSFNNGWLAYEITNDWLTDSWYMKLLIPVFGKEIKNHVLVNNWENGWQIGNQLSVFSSQSEKNKSTADNRKPITIVLVYLPQYLEYLGFGLLFLTSIFLLRLS